MSVNVLVSWWVEDGAARRKKAHAIVHFDFLKFGQRGLGLALVGSDAEASCRLAEAQVLWDVDVHGYLAGHEW